MSMLIFEFIYYDLHFCCQDPDDSKKDSGDRTSEKDFVHGPDTRILFYCIMLSRFGSLQDRKPLVADAPSFDTYQAERLIAEGAQSDSLPELQSKLLSS